MDIIEDKITNFKITNNNFIISCEKYDLYFNIIDGTVNIDIYNILKNKLGIEYLKVNDVIKIYYKKKYLYLNKIKNIKKIIINSTYEFNDESSDSETFNNF
uniref:Uncharacterized protein n=1 Tax=Megaviridae environmental sample TaxID=1737588 RepID=A0A5J6VKR0_9VIRU|nr:MAG: hypothetical protein [Megaviridae environmental sample]